MSLPPKNLYNKRFENMSIFYVWFTSIQAGNMACNYRTHYHLVLLHKFIKITGFVTSQKTFVTRNKFPLVKEARNARKVEHTWCRALLAHLGCWQLWVNVCRACGPAGQRYCWSTKATRWRVEWESCWSVAIASGWTCVSIVSGNIVCGCCCIACIYQKLFIGMFGIQIPCCGFYRKGSQGDIGIILQCNYFMYHT